MKIKDAQLDDLMLKIAKQDFGDKPFQRRDLMERTEERLQSKKLWEVRKDGPVSGSAGPKSKGMARIDYRFITLKRSYRLWNVAHGFWMLPDDATVLESSDLDEPPTRIDVIVRRIARDTPMVRELKWLHGNKCQCCEKVLEVNKRAYSEGHHLRPLGKPHNGPDKKNNIVILCPNCHVLFDYKAIPCSALKHPISEHQLAEEHKKYHDNLYDEA